MPPGTPESCPVALLRVVQTFIGENMSSLAKAVSVAILLGTAGQSAAADTGPGHARPQRDPQQPGGDAPVRQRRLHARDVIVDRDGTEHVRFNRTYKGLPVIGGDLVVHSKAGVLQRTSITQAKPLYLSTTPALTASRDHQPRAGLGLGYDVPRPRAWSSTPAPPPRS